MPFALAIIGIVLLSAAIQNTQGTLYDLLKSDITGPNSFLYWLVIILLVGALGYIEKLRPLSIAFMSLLIIVLFLKKGDPVTGAGGGFFNQFTTQLGQISSATPAVPSVADTSLSWLKTLSNLSNPIGANLPTFLGGTQ